jgi:hypothetical protein
MTQESTKKKTWLDHYERVLDNILRILWLILLVGWVYYDHKL